MLETLKRLEEMYKIIDLLCEKHNHQTNPEMYEYLAQAESRLSSAIYAIKDELDLLESDELDV
jgi:hypothetical protein